MAAGRPGRRGVTAARRQARRRVCGNAKDLRLYLAQTLRLDPAPAPDPPRRRQRPVRGPLPPKLPAIMPARSRLTPARSPSQPPCSRHRYVPEAPRSRPVATPTAPRSRPVATSRPGQQPGRTADPPRRRQGPAGRSGERTPAGTARPGPGPGTQPATGQPPRARPGMTCAGLPVSDLGGFDCGAEPLGLAAPVSVIGVITGSYRAGGRRRDPLRGG